MSSTPALGSLTQAARTNQLRSARTILLIIGLLTVGANLVFMSMVRSQVDQAIQDELKKLGPDFVVDHQKLEPLRERAVRVAYLIQAAGVGLGLVFIVFWAIVERYPVPITITALVLYVGASAAFGFMDPKSLFQGLIVKVIIVVALLKSIQSAIASQRAQGAAAPPVIGND